MEIKELHKFRIYRLVFIGTFKKYPFGIHEIGGKKVFIVSTKKSFLGLKTVVYLMPIDNPIPVAIVIGGLAVLSGLGLTIYMLKEIKEISPIVYGVLGLIGLSYYMKLRK